MTKSKFSLRKLLILIICCLSIVYIERQVSILWGKYAVQNSELRSYNFAQAIGQTGIAKKKILLNFSAYWCGACRQFERKILADKDVQTAIEENFLYVRLEQTDEQHDALFERYNITAYPTLLVADALGTPIEPIVATTQKENFLAQITSDFEN